MVRTRVSRPIAALLLVGAAHSVPPPAVCQTVRVAAEQEAFHQTADGRRLATVVEDAELRVLSRQGAWTEVALEGWIWSRSVARSGRQGFDLVVTADGGENLRAEPGGRIVARLLRGFLLEEVEDARDQWTRVRRVGWMRTASLSGATETPAAGASPVPASGPGPAQAATAGGEPGERVVVGSGGVGLRTAPDGDTLATARAGAQMEVVARRRGWARVRMEGWVPASELISAADDSLLADIGVRELKANPDAYQGRRVRWTVQFIALERAEAVRTDFYEGEPFVLARPTDSSEGFVYLAVPERLLEEVRELRPLQSIPILATVRTGRSALMGVPVLDLLALH